MSAIGTLTISGSVFGSPSGGKTIAPPVLTNTNASLEVLEIPLASGDNTIAVPANAKAVVITPPQDNTTVLKWGGSTGTPMSKTNSLLYPFDSPPPASIVINAAGVISELTEFNFV